ncbi:MAG: FG-GAP-like repeat-containing protein [Bacteroidota bacterium]
MKGHQILYRFLIIVLLLAGCSKPDLNDPAVQASLQQAENMGLAYLEENRFDDAAAAFETVIALNPEDPAGHANLGIVHLRRGDYTAAEKAFNEALARKKSDPDIFINLATVFQQTDRIENAREILRTSLETNPEHVQTLYQLAQSYGGLPEDNTQFIAQLQAVIQYAPANVVPRFFLIEALTSGDFFPESLDALMALQQQLPAIPQEAQPYFDRAVQAFQAQDTTTARASSRIFHNLMKATPYYQTSLRLLGIRTDLAAGNPVVSQPVLTAAASTDESAFILDNMQFNDATEGAGFTSREGNVIDMVLFDYDGDNETDLITLTRDVVSQNTAVTLYQSRFGRFTDVSEKAGIDSAISNAAKLLVADFDNDTFPDIFISRQGPDVLLSNAGDGTFAATTPSGLDTEGVRAMVVADIDHDGDLDLITGTKTHDRVFRNNADGTYSANPAAGLRGENNDATNDIDIGDFDDDGDLDLLFSRSSGLYLYSNQQQGIFALIATAWEGLSEVASTGTGDFNNDGFLDVISASTAGIQLHTNQGTGAFADPVQITSASSGQIAVPLDVDNDGLLDFFLAGAAPQLWHNAGKGFTNATTTLLPVNEDNAIGAHYTDYNNDRDLDLFLNTPQGITLLRNDGGNQNRMVSIQTRGLVTNNSKNNYYSIGAKVEVRAGDLYQMQVVNQPVTYFGLGKRLQADVIRIVFTNGVPQNIFSPGTDQDIIEQQILKGSCPFLYTWNGTGYTFATDLLWRNALGMPLGIMAGGETAYAPAMPAEDYVLIPGPLVPKDGRYAIKVTGELWETPYIDEIKLLLVDHPATTTIRIDEKFGAAPSTPLPVYVLEQVVAVTAMNSQGTSVTAALSAADQQFVPLTKPTRYQGLMQSDALELVPAAPINPDEAVLYLKGWIFPTDASINVALSQTPSRGAFPPRVQVRNEAGDWQTVIPSIGFPMGKNKTVRVDLRGKFLTDDHAVRIESNMQIYWDHAFFAEEVPQASTRNILRRTSIAAASADLRYRGFSRMYRSSPFGPHLFDHDSVSTTPRWQDLKGQYTRFGEVAPLLSSTDDQYVIMNAGDAIEITFDANAAPQLPEGWQRSFILYTNGWLKDGDLNTAAGRHVEPLPFVGMTAYPYSEAEAYPMTPANKAYHATYNTRTVTREAFRNQLKP